MRGIEPKRLSACLIVRDEEQFIAQCLESLAPVADQIVVVDTGSTDTTIDLASGLGAEVHEFEWINDFAAARNESLRHATGNWVLVLDGDEHLDPDSHDEIRRLMETDDLTGYMVRIHNYTDRVGETSFIEHRLLRLFPNHPELRFRGRDPHAQLQPTRPDLPFRILPCTVLVHHEGYRPQVLDEKEKLERNRRYLEQAVQEEPHEGFHAFNLGMTYSVLGRSAEAERELLRSVALSLPATGSHPEYLVNAYLSLAVATYHQGRFAEAVAYSGQALALAPDFADAHLTVGAALTRLGSLDAAYAAYARALGTPYQGGPAATDSAAVTWKPLLGMAGVEMQRGRWDLAIEHLERAHELAPDNPHIAVQVARASLAVGKVDAAEQVVDLVATRDDAPPETWTVLADVHLARGRSDAAEAALRKGLRSHPAERADYEALIRAITEQPGRSTDS